jgi:hypothetical protein
MGSSQSKKLRNQMRNQSRVPGLFNRCSKILAEKDFGRPHMVTTDKTDGKSYLGIILNQYAGQETDSVWFEYEDCRGVFGDDHEALAVFIEGEMEKRPYPRFKPPYTLK